MADSTNQTWRDRSMIPSKFWNLSTTYYDADYQPISVNNAVPRPVPKYAGDIVSDMHILENLIWLISSNKDQSMLILHQFHQGMICHQHHFTK